MLDVSIVERKSETLQGAVISLILANIFMHYSFDKWMSIKEDERMWT